MMTIKVQIEAVSILRHTSATTMFILKDSHTLNPILATAVRVKLRSWLWVGRSRLNEQDTGDAADLVTGTPAAEVDFGVKGVACAACAVVDDDVVVVGFDVAGD